MKRKLKKLAFTLVLLLSSISYSQLTCGNTFADSGGANGTYQNNETITTTICPSNPNEIVSVSFYSFSLEDNFDFLNVYDGTSSLIGTYTGNVSPGTITASVPGQCLTFIFTSDASVTAAGWYATINCDNTGTVTCPTPQNVTPITITSNSVAFTWTEMGTATQWEILLDGTESIITTSNPFTFGNLSPGVHNVMVRSICSATDVSNWSNILTFVIETPQDCLPPTQISPTVVTQDSITITWNAQNNVSSWEVIPTECGTPGPTATTVGIPTNVTTFTLDGAPQNTCYNFYVRTICSSGEISEWSLPFTAITLQDNNVNPSCGGQFFDGGGLASNYLNNSNNTYLICPSQVGDAVTVTFTSFNTESNFDGLYVYNGSTTNSPQISSNNSGGNVPGGLPGSFWGTSIPGPFTSTDVSGCLTFRFISDGSVNSSGWAANVSCTPLPTCPSPTNIVVTPTSFSDASISWTEIGSATEWEVQLNGAASVITNINPLSVSGLAPGSVNIVMVRAICSPTDISTWNTYSFIMPDCSTPSNISISGITSFGATIGWANQGSSQWEILILPAGSPAPTATSSGTAITSMSYLASGLTAQTAYDVYIRSLCAFNTTSDWSNALTFTTLVASPYLNTNTTLYNSEQLVSNVLINNPCIEITNVTSSTGTNFGSVNGIGFFTNTNPMFPLSSGIILSTGDAMHTPGPNTTNLSDGASSWTGDAELENIITTATGNVMNSFNATKLEFDFTSLNEFMSFNFLFASDEYGTFQCTFSDAFAFLLTDLVTGTTTNLAVVPGTSTPVSVVTIRDTQFNPGCNSQNPSFFDSYNGNGNEYNSASNFNGQTVLMTASSAIIPNHPYHIKLVIADRGDSAYDSAVFIQSGSFTSGPPECNERVQLVAFVDDNNNGIKDTNENNFTYGSFGIEENNNGTVTNITSPFGSYTIYDSTATTYDFSYTIDSEYGPYYTASGVSYNDINIALNTDPILYFPITLTQGYNDVTVSITPLIPPRPGFSYTNKVVYKNLGVTATSGTVTYNNDPATTIASVSQAGTTTTATGLTYDFVNLQPYESRSFTVTMNVPAIPTVNIDDVLTSTASVSAPANDINLNNNLFTNSEIVVAAYDPNDITESHGERIQIDQFSANDYLYYTIRFQNMGTASAINVRIENLLDNQLDENSIRMVSASHNYIMERVGNQLIWKFNYINLVSHLQNEALSKGYITYKIKVKPGFAVGDIIPNTAGIYFDTNPVVVTNTFNTEFVTALGTTDFGSNNMLIFPNPANSTIQISLQNTSETLNSVSITDILGKNIRTMKVATGYQTNIDIADLSQGVYFVEIITQNGLKQTKKLIKE